MKATIDSAGRVVIPKWMRDHLGIRMGEIEIEIDGAGIRIEPVTAEDFVEVDGWLVIPPSGAGGAALTAEDVQHLRDADQK